MECLEFGVSKVKKKGGLLKLSNMKNKEFSKKLEARTKAFAIRIIKLSATLPNTVEGKIIRNLLAPICNRCQNHRRGL